MIAPGKPSRRFNIPLPTFGGFQFWSDEMVGGGWRIQRSALFGHCRLLDPRLIRRAWGTFEECEGAFRRLADPKTIQPRSDEVVILLHGLGRTRRSLRCLKKRLDREGYEVFVLQYASMRGGIEDHAARLARVVERMPRARRIHFVGHSLGGIVVRCYLRDHRDPRIGRLVMLCPPNQGSSLARRISRWPVLPLVLGEVRRQLSDGPEGVVAQLPVPWCEFAVIAGGRGGDRGYSFLLPGDNDGVVCVEETRLEGMKDFLLVPATHTFIMHNRRAQDAIVRFLRTGNAM